MKKLYFILGLLAAALSLVCLYLFIPKSSPSGSPLVRESTEAVEKRGEAVSDPGSYVSPVDFTALREMNPDIYAWLYIPGTGINHPILQSVTGDDNYYLTHNVELNEDENGCLFTQYHYSDRDFQKPVTVIYGHRRRSGEMFGTLEKQFSAEDGIYKYNKIVIYTPDRELHYQVFGQSQFSNVHINLSYYSYLDNTVDLSRLVSDITHYHTFTRQFDKSVSITSEDRLLVLSTCLVNDESQRYLVLAKLVDEIN